MDLLKQNAPNGNNKEGGSSELIMQEDKVSEKTEKSEAPNIQLQLLEVLKSVSSSQDLSMLQEVMDTLNTALGGDSQEERRHILESIKEESSGGEDEGSEEGDCQSAATSHQSSPQSPVQSQTCKVEEVKNKVDLILLMLTTPLVFDIRNICFTIVLTFPLQQLYSIQDYLECVGRLQDHADVLDDVGNDLLTQAPVGNHMEELQIQIDECQSLESQLSRLAGVLTADLEKAKQLMNSADEGVPIQIQQDLASTYLELEPNFMAVSQMCTDRGHSLIQAMEAGKVHLESTYQKHLSDLKELADIVKHSSEMNDRDLNTCDVETLKHLIQQNRVSLKSHFKKVSLFTYKPEQHPQHISVFSSRTLRAICKKKLDSS
ncbi:uncharacterized protein LKV04_005954 [Tautogolabrus adspersus]